MIIKAISTLLLICNHGSYAWTTSTSKSTLTTITSSFHTNEFIDSASESESNNQPTERRNFLVSALATATTVLSNSQPSFANDDEGLIDVYFGCGCFWHVQQWVYSVYYDRISRTYYAIIKYSNFFFFIIGGTQNIQNSEFALAEKRILGRSPETLTSRTGYAGGKAGALDGKVCYHNSKRISDYGALGHAEVVSLRIPPSSFKEFAIEYVNLFDKNGFRPDQAGDRGSEYRNLVGFPGGAKSDVYLKQLVDASKENGDKLAFAEGLGVSNEPSLFFIVA